MLSCILIAFYSLYPLLIERSMVSFFVSLGIAVTQLAIFCVIFYRYKKKNCSNALVAGLFFIFFISLVGFGVYTGTSYPNRQSVLFPLILLCSQVAFISIDIIWNLLLNLAAVLVFSFAVIALKPREIWRSDIVFAAIAGIIGSALSWYVSRALIQGMNAAKRLEIERNVFKEESIRDELTGLGNRRNYTNSVTFFISVCQHLRQTVCAIMMDVDFFKRYNDRYGHQKGDMVLQSIGKVLSRIIDEEKAFAARVGGEEFILLWMENRISETERVALKLQRMIAELNIPHEDSTIAPYVTASFGLYILRGGGSDSADELYRKADSALYAAKNSGRNCIILLDSLDGSMRRVENISVEKPINGRRQEEL